MIRLVEVSRFNGCITVKYSRYYDDSELPRLYKQSLENPSRYWVEYKHNPNVPIELPDDVELPDEFDRVKCNLSGWFNKSMGEYEYLETNPFDETFEPFPAIQLPCDEE